MLFLRNLRYLNIFSSYSNLIYTKRTEIYSGFRRTLQIQATTFDSGDINRQTHPDNFETDLMSGLHGRNYNHEQINF